MSLHTFEMRNCLECVDPMTDAVMEAVDGSFEGELPIRVRICLSEALYNLVIHAETPDKSAPIAIVSKLEGDSVTLQILDPVGAAPFDIRAHAPELSQIDVMAENGRGLALIMDCADGVDYGAVQGRNGLTLQFVPREDDAAAINS